MGEFLNGILDNIRRKVGAMVGPVLPGAGNLPDALAPACTLPSAGQLAFTLKNNSGSAKANATDKGFVVVYPETANDWIYLLDVATRNDGPCLYPGCNGIQRSVGAGLAGPDFHGWQVREQENIRRRSECSLIPRFSLAPL